METPNALPAGGNTTEQAEFEAGETLRKQGKELPANASAAAKKGYDSYKGPIDSKAQPSPAPEVDEGPKELTTHRTAIQAQTDRPVPTTLQDDVKLNVNADVKIVVLDPGVRYGVEGFGAKVEIDFNDVTEEALLAILLDRLEGPQTQTGSFTRNAAKDVDKALDWLKERTKYNLDRHGVTENFSGEKV